MTTAATPADEDRVVRADLDLDPRIVELVERDLLPRRRLAPDTFWAGVAGILDELTPRNDALLARRAELQAAIDDWHRTHDTIEPAEYRRFLEELGYLEPSGEAFEITTSGVAAEIATVAGPQLVVPVTNARYAINAVNARWGSLYDAVYGTDVLGSPPPAGPYDEARGAAVIAEVRRMLDVLLPLGGAAHADVTRYLVAGDRLVVELAAGGSTVAADTVDLVGWDGASASPSAVVCRHHGLGVELVIEPASPVGRTDVAGVSDVRLESAVTTIMDCEDSVATVDGSDKAVAYRNWFGLLDGSLEAPVDKDGRTFVRRLRPERTVTGPGGTLVAVPTRAVLLVRTVGLLMRTPAVRRAGVDAYEGIVDAVLTVLGAAAATGDEPVYVVKPKLHGPDEVRFTSDLFAAVEDLVGLPRDTVKIGIMDEERRTTLNLAECVRAARSRVVFVNTGFLDRTGDEIHTSMHAGPMVRKADMRTQRWIGAYERNNVEVGLRCGLPGRAQIGKGMWAAPDLMRDMLATKVAHPEAGASCAWVPSPTAATLHAIHYHHVDVAAVQVELARAMVVDGRRVEVDDLLAVPLATDARWSPAEIQAELDNNAQGILGYVVRWVDQGVGCSKVPDIHDVGLMEDRATCRISSQHLANWLLHGVVTPDQVMDTMRRMARVVDEQNVGDAAYRPMAPGYDGDAFRAACELVLAGTEHPSGYTEPVLHAHRLAVKHAEG